MAYKVTVDLIKFKPLNLMNVIKILTPKTLDLIDETFVKCLLAPPSPSTIDKRFILVIF